MTTLFVCPHCRRPLAEVPGGVACPLGHRFDRAREGYVHLLPSGRHRSRPAGDDAAMVRARRAFFDAGHYRPVMDAVAAMTALVSPDDVLDAGCGEGSYLAAVTAATGAQGWGVDVSKAAVRIAARRHRQHHYAVASSFVLPFADRSLGAVLTVFAPRHFPELLRVVRPSGGVIVASPGPGHLAALRALLYDDPRPHEPKAHVSGDGGPSPQERTRVCFELVLTDPVDAGNLLRMTPYWWRARPEQQAALTAGPLRTTVDVWVTLHRPR